MYVIFSSRFTQTPLSQATQASVAASFIAVVALIALVLVGSVRHGIRRLDAIEP